MVRSLYNRGVRRLDLSKSTKPVVGRRIVEGLEQAIAWSRGQNDQARVMLVQVPEVEVRNS